MVWTKVQCVHLVLDINSYFVRTGCYTGDLPPAAEGPCHSERSGRTAGKVFRKLQPSRRRRTTGEQPVSLDIRIGNSLYGFLLKSSEPNVPLEPSCTPQHRASNHPSLCSISWKKKHMHNILNYVFINIHKSIINISHCVTAWLSAACFKRLVPLAEREKHWSLKACKDPERLIQVLVGELISCISNNHTVGVGFLHIVKLWEKSCREIKESYFSENVSRNSCEVEWNSKVVWIGDIKVLNVLYINIGLQGLYDYPSWHHKWLISATLCGLGLGLCMFSF